MPAPPNALVWDAPVRLVAVRTADGVLLSGALAGSDGRREGIIAVHGAWGSFSASPTSELLRAGPRRGLRVVALNNRGHDVGSLGDGEPSIGLAGERFEDCVHDLDAAADLLAASGVERYVVVAHSFGCHKAAFWLRTRVPAACAACVLLSPAPPLSAAGRWFVEGSVDGHLREAAAAVAAGDPRRLIVLSRHAPVPMVAEAATALSIWGSQTQARSVLHVGDVSAPVLVVSGAREPAVYRDEARLTAQAAMHGELLVVDDDHYYAVAREAMADRVVEWAVARLPADGVRPRPSPPAPRPR
jgi:pimeloyl-ACP methyl ester carboxylesterase